MEISISTARRSDKVNKRISLQSNDPQNKQVYLEGEALVRSALKVEPQTVNFGKVERTAAAQTQTITILRGDGGPLSPKIESTGHDGVTATLREIQPGEKYEIDLTVGPPWPNGMLRGNLALETGVEQSPKENILYFASVVPRLATVPNRFMIPAEVKQELKLTARLQWSGTPGKILEVSTTAPDTTVELKEQGDQLVVELRVPQDYHPARSSGYNVVLKTDDPEIGVYRIPVYMAQARTTAGPRPTPNVKRTTVGPPPPPAPDGGAAQPAADQPEVPQAIE